MVALQRHRYDDAAGHFRELLLAVPAADGLLDRARVYLDVCERALRCPPACPATIEERLTAATAALNNDDTDAARRFAREVLECAPAHELALYLLAAAEARRGAADAAIGLLGQAIAASPEVRAQARHDVDFESLRELAAFRELIDAPGSSRDPRSGPRPARRGRTHP